MKKLYPSEVEEEEAVVEEVVRSVEEERGDELAMESW